MSRWDYRVTRQRDVQEDSEEFFMFEIRAVHYDDAGVITYWTEEPCAPYAETMSDLGGCLTKMAEALTKPVFDLDTRTAVAHS